MDTAHSKEPLCKEFLFLITNINRAQNQRPKENNLPLDQV